MNMLDLPYENEQMMPGKGHRVLLHTDGIPEATNAQNQLYESAAPLEEVLKHHKADRADAFIKGSR